MVGVAFECAAEVEAAVAASGVIDTPARDVDPRVRPSDDDADVATTRVARSSAPVDSPEPSASSLGLGLPSDSEHDDDVHDDVHDDDDGDAAAAVRIEADVLTRLYQNKRKCVEREERRVAARRAAEQLARHVRYPRGPEYAPPGTPTWVIGGCAGVTFYLSTLPIDRVKTIMMTQPLTRAASAGVPVRVRRPRRAGPARRRMVIPR